MGDAEPLKWARLSLLGLAGVLPAGLAASWKDRYPVCALGFLLWVGAVCCFGYALDAPLASVGRQVAHNAVYGSMGCLTGSYWQLQARYSRILIVDRPPQNPLARPLL